MAADGRSPGEEDPPPSGPRRDDDRVDVYAGELSGLVVAEIEFSSEEESERFEAPDWLGRELTGEREFENATLAQEGLPE